MLLSILWWFGAKHQPPTQQWVKVATDVWWLCTGAVPARWAWEAARKDEAHGEEFASQPPSAGLFLAMLMPCHLAGRSWQHHAVWVVVWNAVLCCAVQRSWSTEALHICERLATSWRLLRIEMSMHNDTDHCDCMLLAICIRWAVFRCCCCWSSINPSVNEWKVHMWNVYHYCRNICNSSWMPRSGCHQDAPAVHNSAPPTSSWPPCQRSAALHLSDVEAQQQPVYVRLASSCKCFTVHASCSQYTDPSSKFVSQILCTFATGLVPQWVFQKNAIQAKDCMRTQMMLTL